MRMLLLTWIYLFIFVNEIGLTFMRLESEKWSISLIGLEEGVSNMCLILKPIITIWLGPLGLNNSQASVLLSPPPMPMPMPCGQDVYASKLFFLPLKFDCGGCGKWINNHPIRAKTHEFWWFCRLPYHQIWNRVGWWRISAADWRETNEESRQVRHQFVIHFTARDVFSFGISDRPWTMSLIFMTTLPLN